MTDHLPEKNDPAPTVRDRRVSAWWRALAILLALLLFIGGATGLSLFEQFKTQIRHLQGQLVLGVIGQMDPLLDLGFFPAR